MKLLNPNETEECSKRSDTEQKRRSVALHDEVSREEKDFNLFKTALHSKRLEIEEEFADKFVVLVEKQRVLEEAIGVLERKREVLLRPLDDTPELITKNLAVTEELLDYLKNRKQELSDAKQELLTSQKQADKRLEELLDRENWLNGREVDIDRRLRSAKLEEVRIAKSNESFSTEANKKSIELMLFEGKLNKHEVELAEREKLLADDKAKIAIDRKRLESQQQTLIAAMQEAKNNKQI